MAAFMFRGRSLKSRRMKGRGDGSEEPMVLDYKRDPAENFKETLYHITKQEKISKGKRLGYYNALVRLCYRFGSNYDIGLSIEETFNCLRTGLIHEEKEIRVACLRTLRYVCHDERGVDALLNLNIDYLIARSLDINIDNELERIHAMKLAKKILQISPHKFPQSLVSVFISVANNGAQERDKLHRTCLAMLCELSFSNPCLVCRRGGINAILNNVLQCHSLPRLNESLLTTVLYLLNHPCTRHFITSDVGIEQLLAPFTDCHFKHNTEIPDPPFGEESNSKYTACKMAISTLVKSWPGLIRLCRPDGTGLQSLIGVLYLPSHETRKEVLDLLFDVFRLQVPEWTDNFAQALVSVDPSEMRESWKVSEGFVAEEGRCILNPIAQTRADLVSNHTALVLAAFVTAGLLEALVEVVTDADCRVSIRATILLGELLHLANGLIPIDCGYHSHCLPTLIDIASSFDNPKRNKASMAVKCLDRLHSMKKRGAIPCSLFLDQLVKRAKSRGDDRILRPLSANKQRLLTALEKPAAWHIKPKKLNTLEKIATATSNNEVDHDVNQAIKDSLVLQTKENLQWNWQLISAIVKWPDDSLKKLEDQVNQRFIRRLLFFFKPDNKLFSTLELANPLSKEIASAGQHFLKFLLYCDNDESRKYLKEWIGNVAACVSEIKGQRAPPEALLSAHRVINTCAQYYFLYIGVLSGTAQGDLLLDNIGVYQNLLELVSTTSHDNYVKLVVSSLDYGKDGQPRVILGKALKSASDNARVYCVNILRVLLRAKVPFFHQWGMDFLVLQLYDQHKPVCFEALAVLSEACEDENHLQSVAKLRPSVLQLGTNGSMFLARLMSIPQGFLQLNEAGIVQNEVDNWNKKLNKEYVDLVEEKLCEAHTTYEKSYDGSYFRRSTRRQRKSNVIVPIHIYAQLVQHQEGYNFLHKQRQVQEYADILQYQTTRTEEEIHKVKEALWAMGNAGTSAIGLELLQEYCIIPQIIKLAEESGVFSIRGTSFYALGLISCTCKGADMLNEFGWESIRHKLTDKWPVLDDPATASLAPSEQPAQLSHCASAVSLASSIRSEGFVLPAVTLEPPSSSQASPPAFMIGSGEESLPSSYKSRSNTVNTLETLSENESGDCDEEKVCDKGNEMKANNQNGDVYPKSEIVREMENAEMPKPNAIAQDAKENNNDVLTETSSNLDNEKSKDEQQDNGESNSNNVHELKVSDLFKSRSQSSPADYDKKPEVIHPRTTSDPRGMSQSKLDGQAAVHFKDPDLENLQYDKSILRRKNTGGSTCDGGISISSNPSSSKSRGAYNERAGSHDSYRTATDKSRSNSLNTESSGVSSFGSSYPNHMEVPGLSPIPSASSVYSEQKNRDSMQSSLENNSSVHPSDSLRRMANLKRVPSTKRRFSNPVLTPILKTLQRDSDIVNEYVLSYTSTRDVQGYATLRELKRFTRLDSTEGESDNRIRSLNEQSSPIQKTQSLDLRALGRLRKSFREKLRRRKIKREVSKRSSTGSNNKNMSLSSLQEMDVGQPAIQTASALDLTSTHSGATSGIGTASGLQRIPTIPNIRKPKPVSTGRPEFLGICLPVDVTMMFHVNEGEDTRSVINMRERMDKKSRKSLPTDPNAIDDGFEHHCVYNCLACYVPKNAMSEQACDSVSDQEDAFMRQESTEVFSNIGVTPSPNEGRIHRRPRCGGIKSRHSSLSELVDSMSPQESVSSQTSVGKGGMNEDTFEGRVLVRKEILRLVVNCSSSVSTDSTEQGLLILKQKFPKSFQDVCLYSEISYLLATYNYRLKARKFIQELFQDMTFEKLREDIKALTVILGKDFECLSPTQTPKVEQTCKHEQKVDSQNEFKARPIRQRAKKVHVQISEDDDIDA